jgi:hypothetical protein
VRGDGDRHRQTEGLAKGKAEGQTDSHNMDCPLSADLFQVNQVVLETLSTVLLL